MAAGPPVSGDAAIGTPPDFLDYIRSLISALRSGRTASALNLYENGRRDVNMKFFSGRMWPDADVVCAEVAADSSFRLIYKTLWLKHVFMSDPRVPVTAEEELAILHDAWPVYVEFVREGLSETPFAGYTLPPDWVYDVVNEFVWLFELYHEEQRKRFRAGKGLVPGDEWGPASVIRLLRGAVRASGVNEELALAQARASSAAPDAWAVPEVTQLLGTFALVCLVRVEAKLGDHGSAVHTARNMTPAVSGRFVRVTRANLSLYSYLGFSLAMAGKYAAAAASVSRVLLLVQRASSLLEEGGQSSRYMRNTAERLLALVALCAALSPGTTLDELIRHKAHERFSGKIESISAGGAEARGALSELFTTAAPSSFVDASWPPPSEDPGAEAGSSSSSSSESEPTAGGAPRPATRSAKSGDQVAAVQKRVFLSAALARVRDLTGVRSLLRLYKTVDVPKLARLGGLTEAKAHAGLIALKLHRLREGSGSDDAAAAAAASQDTLQFVVGGADGAMVSAMEAKGAADHSRALIRQTLSLSRTRTEVLAGGRR